MGLEFVTTLDEYMYITVYGDKRDIDFTCNEVVISWYVYMEARSWGVKTIQPCIKTVEGIIIDGDTGQLIESLKDYGIENNISTEGGCIQVSEVEIDMVDKIITVS